MIVRQLTLILASVLFSLSAMSQNSLKEVSRGWHLMDLKQDGVYGIGVEKAYETILKNKKPKHFFRIFRAGGEWHERRNRNDPVIAMHATDLLDQVPFIP